MKSDIDEPEFPHWWDLLDEPAAERRDRGRGPGQSFATNATSVSGATSVPGATSEVGVEGGGDSGVVLSGSEEMDDHVSEADSVAYEVAAGEGGSGMEGGRGVGGPHRSHRSHDPRRSRGYDRELVESVWNFAEVIPGNDPELWRKDEWGNWIRRLDYGRRDSQFGWEIFDPGIGRHSQGVYAMRPMQWASFLEQYEILG